MFANKHIVLALLAVLSGVLPAVGESLSFKNLRDISGPFEGTDRLGRAFFKVELGKAGPIPVYACWSSSGKRNSPYLGFGWSIPMLESRIAPISEKALKLVQPDGYVRYFRRAKDGSYIGGRFWTAKKNGDVVRVVADPRDGLPRSEFTYSHGRLARMECEEGSYEFRYDPRLGDAILFRGSRVFSLVKDEREAGKFTLQIAGKGKYVGRCRKTMVYPLPVGDSLALEPEEALCLAELESPAGQKTEFTYGVADEENPLATFAVGPLNYTWDPHSRHLVKLNGWSYEITGEDDKGGEPRIARRGPGGKFESFHRDLKSGVISSIGADGVTLMRRVFTSGDNAGKVRWRDVKTADGRVERINYVYDDKGNVVSTFKDK